MLSKNVALTRRLRVTVVAMIVVASCVVLVGTVASDGPSSASSNEVRLTGGGQLRVSLEELLHQEFGQQMPAVEATLSGEIDFNCANCGPLAQEDPFLYVFQSTGEKSPFKLVSPADASSLFFGNYGAVVAIRGKLVQCGTAGGLAEYLVAYSDSIDLGLECQATQAAF
jgi:hypothetical protein